MIVAYYFSNQTDSILNAFNCDDEQECIDLLIDAMENIKNNSIPDLDYIIDEARRCVSNNKFDDALYSIDDWIKEYTMEGNVFTYLINPD